MRKSDIIQWDKSNWERALYFLDKNKNKQFENKDVLELGSGDGSLSFWAARAGARVICSDILKPKTSILNQLYNEKISFEIIDVLKYRIKIVMILSYLNLFLGALAVMTMWKNN